MSISKQTIEAVINMLESTLGQMSAQNADAVVRAVIIVLKQEIEHK